MLGDNLIYTAPAMFSLIQFSISYDYRWDMERVLSCMLHIPYDAIHSCSAISIFSEIRLDTGISLYNQWVIARKSVFMTEVCNVTW